MECEISGTVAQAARLGFAQSEEVWASRSSLIAHTASITGTSAFRGTDVGVSRDRWLAERVRALPSQAPLVSHNTAALGLFSGFKKHSTTQRGFRGDP